MRFDSSKDKIKQVFEDYTSAYDINDPKIALKISHTYRVADLCETIAVSLKLSEDEVFIAWLCGMLHDIARFEQVRIYGTFFDSISVDHAEFGADILFRDRLIDTFMDSCEADVSMLICDSAGAIETAIRVHNKFRVPEDVDGIVRTYSDILRDADKIDILKVNCETRPEDVYNVTTEELLYSAVSAETKLAFKERRCAKRSDKTTAADYIVGHILLYYELVYDKSKEIAREQGYWDKIFDFRSDNPDTRAWFEYMKENR